jgi:LacI family transcriptional regulator, gluconate utilization system Gnt-I transcriptional repressor
MPTMSDVALAAGVSQMTVSRAFSEGRPIREETRLRVLEAAQTLGYFHNQLAASLASQKSRSVGIVIPTLRDSIYMAVIEGASEVLEEAGFDYVLQAVGYQKDREPAALQALLARRVQALLMPSFGHSSETRKLLRRLATPLIEFGNLNPDAIGNAVGHSDFAAGSAATRALLARGRRRIALICSHVAETSHARDRRRGYRSALLEAGLPFAPRLSIEIDHEVEAAIPALEQLLAERPAIDALVVGGEIWSPVVMIELAKRAVAVPQRLAVIGIGDFELAPHLPVPMSVVSLPRYETGRAAAAMVVELCAGRPVAAPTVELPCTLIARASH